MNTRSYLDFSRANLLPITLNDRHHYDGLRTYREFIPLLDGRWEVRHRCRGHVPQWCERCGNVGCVGDCDYEQITEQELIRILDSAAYRGSGIWTELRPAVVRA